MNASSCTPPLIGLTGGIGAGKTQVSELFASLGITIIDADLLAREVVALNSPGLAAIATHFGHEILLPDGQLNRAALRQRIFADESQRQWLNQQLHPRIRTALLAQWQQASGPYVVAVVPLLLEGDLPSLMQRIAVVDVPPELQLQRTCARDKNRPELVQKIIASQMERQQRLSMADDVIDNSQDLAHLTAQVHALHRHYLLLGQER
ncbi:MAG: dephospho-CoA kinase [Ferrimonas sp.]